MSRIRLHDAIHELRAELTRAHDAAAKEDLSFEVESVVLEVAVTAESETGVEGKVNWWVFSGGIADKSGSAQTQTITLTLSPMGPDGRPLKINQEQEERAGAAAGSATRAAGDGDK